MLDAVSFDHFNGGVFADFISRPGCRVYRNGQNKQFALCKTHTPTSSVEKGFRPLAFRELVYMGRALQDELKQTPDESFKVVVSLKQMVMAAKEKEGRSFILFRIATHIWDCARNFFKGHGFQSTTTLASKLAWGLIPEDPFVIASKKGAKKKESATEVVPVVQPLKENKSVPEPIAPKVEKPTIMVRIDDADSILGSLQTLTEAPQHKPHLEPTTKKAHKRHTLPASYTKANQGGKTGTVGKNAALAQYVIDPANCPFIKKKMLFAEIMYMDNPVDKLDPKAVAGLMRCLSGQDEIDLSLPVCQHVILDAMQICTKEVADNLIAWLEEQATFDAAMLRDCLAVLIVKHSKQQPFSVFAVEALLKIYRAKGWDSELSIANPILMQATQLLINLDHTKKTLHAHVEWLSDRKEFNFTLWKQLVQVFMKKEWVGHKDKPGLVYPLLDYLVEKLNMNLDMLQEATLASKAAQDPVDLLFFKYIVQKGAAITV